MRRFLTLTLITLACAASVPVASAQSGRITFDETEHRFGHLEEGDRAQHVFTFRNTGDAPLRLRRVVASCGCTTPEWTREPVAPGGTGEVRVVYDTAGRPGPFGKTIHVATDGTPAAVVLRIRGDVAARRMEDALVQGHLLIDREVVDFGTVRAGASAARAIEVQNDGRHPIRFLGVARSPEHVRVELPGRPLFSGDVREVNVVVAADGLAPGSTFDEALVLETDDEAQPLKSFRLTGRVAAAGR